MHHRQFVLFLMLFILNLSEGLSEVSASTEYARRVDFKHYVSQCIEEGMCYEKIHKITCKKDSCQTADPDDNTIYNDIKISASEHISLPCNDSGKVIDISEVKYYSPGNSEEYCVKLDRTCKEDIDLNETVCEKPEICLSPENLNASCPQTHSDVTAKLRSKCLKQKGSCNVFVPRNVIKDYDSCVDLFRVFGYHGNCADSINHCYGKWAVIKYKCVTPKSSSAAKSGGLTMVIAIAVLIVVFVVGVVITSTICKKAAEEPKGVQRKEIGIADIFHLGMKPNRVKDTGNCAV